eukprot:scaffold9887_cov76-Phaeocystis_antarctica.AAC.1
MTLKLIGTELPRAQATQHPEPPVALWPTCARPRQRPASSGQGQAMRRLIPCSMPACPHVIPLGSPAPLPSTPAHR